MVRGLLADDRDVVRRELCVRLKALERWEVCGEASNELEAVKMTLKVEPDVAVLNLSIPEFSGLHATRLTRRN
jgi:two-component system response regulator NreC